MGTARLEVLWFSASATRRKIKKQKKKQKKSKKYKKNKIQYMERGIGSPNAPEYLGGGLELARSPLCGMPMLARCMARPPSWVCFSQLDAKFGKRETREKLEKREKRKKL